MQKYLQHPCPLLFLPLLVPPLFLMPLLLLPSLCCQLLEITTAIGGGLSAPFANNPTLSASPNHYEIPL